MQCHATFADVFIVIELSFIARLLMCHALAYGHALSYQGHAHGSYNWPPREKGSLVEVERHFEKVIPAQPQ